MHAGIFACDEYAVFSNVSMELGGVGSKVVVAALKFPVEGSVVTRSMSSSTVLVFRHLWREVVLQGRWMFYNFTVKVDPDAAFFPERLRGMMTQADRKHAHMGNGIFFRQCASGFQGAVEVLSRRALSAYSLGQGSCDRRPPQEEDYLHRCLRALRVTEIDHFGILASDPCGYRGWERCETTHASFHPFRSVSAIEQCIRNAQRVLPD
jgi:hypothetical protein